MTSFVQLMKHLAFELKLVDYTSLAFRRAIFFIFFNPLFWNAFGRLEHHYRLLTKLFGGNSRLACYAFASLSLVWESSGMSATGRHWRGSGW